MRLLSVISIEIHIIYYKKKRCLNCMIENNTATEAVSVQE